MHTAVELSAVVADYCAMHPDAHLYLLFDHAGLPGLIRKLDSGKMRWASLFDDTRESGALAVAPILVDPASAGNQPPSWFLDWIAQQGAYASAVTMLDSALPLDVLQRRLAARLDIKLSEDMNAMLRFFDPRILAQLRTTLTPEQAAAFFSVAAHWWYIDRAGELIGFEAVFSDTDGPGVPLVLCREQESDMVDASEADQVLALVNGNAPELLASLAFSKRYEFIFRNISEAKKAGLTSIYEFVIYVAHKANEIKY